MAVKLVVWGADEVDLLKQVWSTALTAQEIRDAFPNRSKSALESKASKLGLLRRHYWTPESDALLAKMWPTSHRPEILKVFPERTYQGLADRAHKIGVQRTLAARNTYRGLKTVVLTNTEAAYIAGIVDGEGWLGVITRIHRRISFTPYLGVTNTDYPLLAWLKGKINGNIDLASKARKGALGKKPGYNLRIFGPSIITILKQIIPYMIVKKEHATWVLKLTEIRQSRGWKQPLTEQELGEYFAWRESRGLRPMSSQTTMSTTSKPETTVSSPRTS